MHNRIFGGLGAADGRRRLEKAAYRGGDMADLGGQRDEANVRKFRLGELVRAGVVMPVSHVRSAVEA